MCGILGTHNHSWPVADKLHLIAHRGPDGHDVRRHGDSVHGHVRLALLDLSSASAQPFVLGDGVLSFVGEIWNHNEVREDLRGLGRSFRTSGDTEVLATALDQWGVRALAILDGMFAFAWTSPGLNILARDRFGKVPLYLQRDGFSSCAWSSERRALPAPAAAEAVPPGSIYHLDEDRFETWYALPAPEEFSSEDPAGFVRTMLERGVRRRLAADAPVCVLSSGGLDSTLIMALARARGPVTAFTAVLDGGSEDLAAARYACAQLDVPLVEVPVGVPTPEDLEAAVRAIEIPTKAQVEIAALCLPLARAISDAGFKACLSGEAADELFGGYGNMCIAASRENDDGWRTIRVKQLAKMARGNFVRCNKAFMAAGVECRLPFMERGLVEGVLSMGKADCPPGKGLLKKAAAGLVPVRITRREKETFQGASGMREAAAAAAGGVARRFYNAAAVRAFGGLTTC